jgi:DNA-binding transcriptional regulator PaaX
MEATMPAKSTKTAIILKLLRRPKGASVAELQKAVGWKDHSIRAALTALRKKGHDVVRDQSDAGISRYRVSEEK